MWTPVNRKRAVRYICVYIYMAPPTNYLCCSASKKSNTVFCFCVCHKNDVQSKTEPVVDLHYANCEISATADSFRNCLVIVCNKRSVFSKWCSLSGDNAEQIKQDHLNGPTTKKQKTRTLRNIWFSFFGVLPALSYFLVKTKRQCVCF